MRIHLAVACGAMLALAGCDRGVAAPPQAAAASRSRISTAMHCGCARHRLVQGQCRSGARRRRKATNKPVLLYWGAQWCPPCKQLKSAVFSRPDFIEKSKLFVAVYLDGDLPDAQKWGDVFRVTGYPTVVVLKSDGSRDHAHRGQHGPVAVCPRARRCARRRAAGQGRDRARDPGRRATGAPPTAAGSRTTPSISRTRASSSPQSCRWPSRMPRGCVRRSSPRSARG